MKLYYTPGSCSLAPHIIAREAALNLEYDKVDLNHRTTASGRDFLRINPKGYVPALALESGEVLTEVSIILEYLADQAPDAELLPRAGSIERYRAKEWLEFIGTELHKGFAPLWDAPMPNSARRLAVGHLQRHFAYLDRCLREQPYLMGGQYTVADAYCFTVLSWSHFHRIDLSDHAALTGFMGRVAERPMVRRALEAEGLLKAA